MTINIVNIKIHTPTPNDFYIGEAGSLCLKDRYSGRKSCRQLVASPLANPFPINKHFTREQVISQYKDWFNNIVNSKPNPHIAESPALKEYCENIQSVYPGLIAKAQAEQAKLKTELQKILTHLKTHGTVNLVCYCAPQACHGDVIKEWLEKQLNEPLN